MKITDNIIKTTSKLIGFLIITCFSPSFAQEASFYESLKLMSIEQREAITVEDWKNGVYSEIKKEFKNKDRIEVFVEYGGAIVKPFARSHTSHLLITDDYKKKPDKYRDYKKNILEKLPSDSYEEIKAVTGDAMILLELDETAFDMLQSNPMVTNYFLNAVLQAQ